MQNHEQLLITLFYVYEQTYVKTSLNCLHMDDFQSVNGRCNIAKRIYNFDMLYLVSASSSIWCIELHPTVHEYICWDRIFEPATSGFAVEDLNRSTINVVKYYNTTTRISLQFPCEQCYEY